jgi:hypothetical protein
MNTNNLIPRVDTGDLDPKSPLSQDGSSVTAEEARFEENRAAAEQTKQEAKKEVKKERSLFVKGVLAIIIVGAVIGIGILLPIKLVPNASSMLATVFNSNTPAGTSTDATTSSSEASSSAVAFTADKMSIQSQDSVKISWNGPVRQDGQYVMRYACANGINVVLLAADGTKPAIPCDTDFRFISLDNTMTLAIESNSVRLTDVPLSFAFVDTAGNVTTFGDVRITVINNFPNTTGQVSTSTGTTVIADNSNSQSQNSSNTQSTGNVTGGSGHPFFASGNPTTSTTGTSNTNTASNNTTGLSASSNAGSANVVTNGKPDLRVRVIATGTLNKTTGQFTPTTAFKSGDRVAVQFEISNAGTGYTGTWNWSALLPTPDSKLYQSGSQASLAPQSGAIFTLGFDNLKQANASLLLISADPGNFVSESNESNNTASATFTSAGGTAQSGNADLKISLVGVGRMNGSSFVEDSSVGTGDKAAVKFRVTNIGGTASGSWKFKANLERPSGSDYTYNSNSVTSLLPGQSTEITVAFGNLTEGRQTFDITLDPSRNITDANRSNNDLTASIIVNN